MPGNCMICGDPVVLGAAHVSCVSMMQRENARLREALTPSDDTRRAFFEQSTGPIISWDIFRMCMMAIRQRAGIEQPSPHERVWTGSGYLEKSGYIEGEK